MDDDTKLKILLYLMLLLAAVAIIGVWESFIKPVGSFLLGFFNVV